MKIRYQSYVPTITAFPAEYRLDRFAMTFSSEDDSYGCSLAKVRTSHIVTPNDHTSLFVVNLPWRSKDM